jgi:hypothetical protein
MRGNSHIRFLGERAAVTPLSYPTGKAFVQLQGSKSGPTMKPFEFHDELFDFRNAVLEALSENGFVWLSDFGAIDLLHDLYGLEVTAIREEADATAIEELLRNMFPDWSYWCTYYEEQLIRELGWKVIISREPQDFTDNWQCSG